MPVWEERSLMWVLGGIRYSPQLSLVGWYKWFHNRTPRNRVGFSLDIFLELFKISTTSNLISSKSCRNEFSSARRHTISSIAFAYAYDWWWSSENLCSTWALGGTTKTAEQKATFISKQAVTSRQRWGKREVWQPQQELDCTWT